MKSYTEFLDAELKALGAGDAEKAVDLFRRGEKLFENGKWPEAADAYHSAMEIVDAPTFRLRFSQCMVEMKKGPDAIMAAKKALELAESLDHAILYIAACEQMASALSSQMEFDKAEVFAREAVDVSKSLNDKNASIRALNTLGVLYAKAGKLEKASKVFHEALELNIEGDDNLKGMADTCGNIGSINYFTGNLEESLKWSLKALETHKAIGDKFSVGMDHYNIGLARERLGALDQAKSHYEEALSAFIDLGMKSHQNEVMAQLEELKEEMEKKNAE